MDPYESHTIMTPGCQTVDRRQPNVANIAGMKQCELRLSKD